MDFLSTFYTTRMRICLDPDTIVTVRWYEAPPDARPCPVDHSFGSTVWETVDREYPSDQLGELGEEFAEDDPVQRVWDAGQPPIFQDPEPGQATSTPLEWFQDGVPAEAIAMGPYPFGTCVLPPGAWWWLRPEGLPELQAGEEVIEWADHSPARQAGRVVEGEVGPLFVPDGGAGLPCVELVNGAGGNRTRLVRGLDFPARVPGIQQTTFCVARLLAPTHGGFRLGLDVNASIAPGVSRQALQVRIDGEGFASFQDSPLDEWHVWHVRRDGANATILRNGNVLASGQTHATAEPQLGAIHATGDASGDGKRCRVLEAIIFQRLLSSFEESLMLAYLANRHLGGILPP